MHTLKILCLVLSAIVISAATEHTQLWSWSQNTEPTQQIKQEYQIESNGAENSGSTDTTNQTEADVFDLDEVVDTILASNRQGRNLDGFDEVYSDPTVQDALQKGDDTQARNLIKEKLCSLGLMQCDGEPAIEGKRPFLPPGELIYAHSPNGPYRGPPLRPPPSTKIMYGPPRPMPPGIVNKFGPPRKVGYAPGGIGPVYSGPPFLNSPPPNFQGPVYHLKPPGLLDSGLPYKFDSGKDTIITNEEYQALQLGGGLSEIGAPPKRIHNDGITGSGSNSVNIHHHYHHIDGQADNAKAPAVIVNNPIPVGSGHSNGLVTGEFSSVNHHQSINGGFNPLTSGYDHQSFKQTGFNNINSGLNNGISTSGIYGAGAKPVFESANNYDSGSNFGTSSFGVSGPGNSGATGFGHAGQNPGNYESGANSYHSSNPDYYKKALKGSSNINSLNSYNSQLGSGFGGLYSNGQNYQGLESARQDNFDCVCVPYDQCPARDVLGRKGDLILPLDPRNLGSDIEALADVTNNTSGSNTTAVTKEEEGKTKNVSKREAIEKSSDERAKVDGEARLFGLGAGAAGIGIGGLGGVGVGVSKKKVEPQFGVSFGLPYPSGAYPLNTFNGGYPAQNPYFGSISPNGLNLGLVNVNPLLSFQFAKNEYGEKTFKPLVNFHVTPNEQLIHKVGNLFKAKKFGGGAGYGGQSSYNQHYHTHTHYQAPSSIYHPHVYDGGHHYIDGHHNHPEIYPDYGVSEYGLTGPAGFTGPGSIYRDTNAASASFDAHSLSNGFYDNGFTSDAANPYEFGQNLYSRSSNYSAVSQSQYMKPSYNYQNVYPQNNRGNLVQMAGKYAMGFQDYNQRQAQNPEQSQSIMQAMQSVSFPTNRRRKRSTDDVRANDAYDESKASKSKIIKKRQSFNHLPQQCGPSQVCCRRPTRPFVQPGQCGRRNTQGITGRIKTPVYVDGDSEFGEYPWQVAILKKDPKESVYVCGGTLIDALHIITAAHCVKTYSGFDLRVRLGEWDVNHDVEFFPYIERDVQSVHVHPEYYAGTLDNDLAILKLNAPVDFNNNPHISPACLPNGNSDFTGVRCWTTGWGKDAFGDFGKYQNILKEVDVPIIGHNQCQQQLRNTRLGYAYQLNPGFICAGGEEGKDACKGDGGGPMVCERNGIWQVVGVVSWGIGCGQVNVPGVYVKVAHYLDWISQIAQQRF